MALRSRGSQCFRVCCALAVIFVFVNLVVFSPFKKAYNEKQTKRETKSVEMTTMGVIRDANSRAVGFHSLKETEGLEMKTSTKSAKEDVSSEVERNKEVQAKVLENCTCGATKTIDTRAPDTRAPVSKATQSQEETNSTKADSTISSAGEIVIANAAGGTVVETLQETSPVIKATSITRDVTMSVSDNKDDQSPQQKKRPKTSGDISRFQQVGGIEPKLYVYSALVKDHDLRIVSIKNRSSKIVKLVCVVWSSTDQHISRAMDASVKEVAGQAALPYVAAYITCHNSQSRKTNISIPSTGWSPDSATSWVGLMKAQGNNTVLVSLPIEGNSKSLNDAMGITPSNNKGDNEPVEFTVCLPPLHSYYSNEAQLVEMLEMSRLLGVGRVVFYNHSISRRVDDILRWYQQRNHQQFVSSNGNHFLVEVKQWNLPSYLDIDLTVDKIIWNSHILHYKGQTVAMDDCLNRYRWRTRYTAFTDLDEFIIPFHHNNWSQLIAHRRSTNPKAKAYMFLNTYFIKQTQTNGSSFQAVRATYKSAVLESTKRENHIFGKEDRSKLIIDPKYVHDMGVHVVFNPRYITEVVPTDEALLCHYKGSIKRTSTQNKDDNRPKDIFGKRLAAQLEYVWSSIHQQQDG